jgi:RNA polymerase sigma-70 factor (ECF subfamily)
VIILEQYNIVNTLDKNNLQELGAVLQRYCQSLTRSSFEADDLAQETWAKALGYPKFLANPNPQALLLRIAKNTWIDAARRKSSLLRALERTEASAVAAGPAAAQGDISGIELAFQTIIKHLSPLQRSAFMLRDVLGYSAAEAAACLKTTEGAVKAALHRARLAAAKVRAELADEDGPALPQGADTRGYLRALAHAYEQGQIPVMLELLRQETAMDTTVAVGTATVQAFYPDNSRRQPSATRSSAGTSLLMAA